MEVVYEKEIPKLADAPGRNQDHTELNIVVPERAFIAYGAT